MLKNQLALRKGSHLMLTLARAPLNGKLPFQTECHAQSLAATNRVTEQLNWLTVESISRPLFDLTRTLHI
jgi:hypothetical protein